MKDYSITAEVNGSERTFSVQAYDANGAQDIVDRAYRGSQGYERVVSITPLSTLPGAKASKTPTTQEQPGVYSIGSLAYWDYIRENLRCYNTVNVEDLAFAFQAAQDEGCYTASQLEAIATVLQDAITHTVARGA